jgi:hypothetical protein
MFNDCETIRKKKIVACVIQGTRYVDANGDDIVQEVGKKFLISGGTIGPLPRLGPHDSFANDSNGSAINQSVNPRVLPESPDYWVRIFAVPEVITSLVLTITAWQNNALVVNGIGPVEVLLLNGDHTILHSPVIYDFGNTINLFPVTGIVTIFLDLPANTPFIIAFRQEFANFNQVYQVKVQYTS